MSKQANGEVWIVRFAEPDDSSDGTLPALVVSSDSYNLLQPPTVVVAPLVERGFDLPCRVTIKGAGIKLDGNWRVACDLIRSVNTDRFLKNCGQVSYETMEAVEQAIAYLLGVRPKTALKRGW